MPWTELDEPESHRAAIYFDVYGVQVGSVVQFYEDGPAYPYVYGSRLGAFESWEAAAKTVEENDRLSRKD